MNLAAIPCYHQLMPLTTDCVAYASNHIVYAYLLLDQFRKSYTQVRCDCCCRLALGFEKT